MKNLSLLVSFSFLVGCTTTRNLSAEEMQKHGLTGIVRDVKYCPHSFNQKNQLVPDEKECEVLNCQEVSGKLHCQAE